MFNITFNPCLGCYVFFLSQVSGDWRRLWLVVQDNASNRLLQVRGNAGTHDLQLGTRTLEALRSAGGGDDNGSRVAVPRYDKSQNGGRGDRADPTRWPHVQGPLDIVLFEGWMLGFRPQPSAAVQQVTLM